LDEDEDEDEDDVEASMMAIECEEGILGMRSPSGFLGRSAE
jgi:hypothetical protein